MGGCLRNHVEYPVGTTIFLFSIMSRLTLGPTQLPIQWVLVALPGDKMARTWSRTIPPLPHMPSWQSQRLLYMYLTC